MPHVVRRYDTEADYLDTTIVGTPVSANMNTWKEAKRVRNLLREGELRYYYNITYTTSINIIDREIEDDER